MNKTIINNTKIGLLLFPLLFILSFCQNANAEMISADNLYKMSLLTSLRTCFGNHAKSPVSYYGLSSWEKFFEKNGEGYDFYSDTSDEVWITTHVGNTLKSTHSESRTRDSNLSCEQLFKGYDGEGKAKGLLDLFQLPAISPTTMSAWGYKPVNTTPPSPSDDPTTDGSKVKITITDIKSLDGNQNPITSEGKIICSAIEGMSTDPSRNKYNWILNCDGTITTKYRGDPLFIIKATYNGPGTGRIWRASAFDGHVTLDGKYDTYKPPYDCYTKDGIDQCRKLKWDETSNDAVSNIIQAAQNVYANDWSLKSALEILNGDAATNQGAGGSLIYRIRMMVESVFLSVYSEPSFKIKVEAVTNDASGEESGGDSEVGTLNYEVINDRQTAGDIFAYNVNFDESLPHFGTEVGGVKFKNYYFDHTAKYSLYYRYLLEVINLWPDEININTCSETKPENGYYFKNKIDQWCNINIPGKLTEDTLGTSILDYTFSTAEETSYQLRKGTFKQVLDWFKNEESYKDIPEDAYANGQVGDDGELDPVDPVDPDPDPQITKPTCVSSGGAGSLGWIICPVLDWMGNAAESLYNNYVKDALAVKASLFEEESGINNDVKDAWGTFQNFANLIFIILFLVVIFSQLTGVGIDNYGIKKILPKLILVAVLMNLSYYICLICIDLSNIVGNGVQSIFDSLGSSLTTKITSSSSIGSEIGTTALTAVPILIALVGVGVAIWENPAILLTLLVSALGVVIAIFFLFILLSARQAAIVVLTVISPLAFVCNILPNTKKMFDKWLNAGKGLLLVYPICGLLVGGGGYVSKLLLTAGMAKDQGFVSAFTAMLVSIVPLFFFPSVLKGSFAALGNIGAKISGFGDRLRGGATRGLRNMDRYKQAQERGIERRTRIRAGYDKNGNKKQVNGLGRFMRGGRRQMQRESLKYQKMISERGSLEATEGEDFMLATETANEMKNIVASGEINNMGTLQTRLQDALISGNRAKIRAYTDALTAKGEDGRDAVKTAYNNAVNSGRMTSASARTFADNIMANHAADYKNNNRSMFEVARSINTGGASTTIDSYIASHAADLAGKVTSTTIGNMDDSAFEETFGGYHSKPIINATKEVGAAAYAALHDQNANIKAERRQYLEKIVAASGYRPSVQEVNVVQDFQEGRRQVEPVDVRIDHGSTSDGSTSGGGTGGEVSQDGLMGVHDNFAGETHINSGTGKVRTYGRMDMYPRMEGESSEAYGARLRMMREKEEEYLRSQGGGHS